MKNSILQNGVFFDRRNWSVLKNLHVYIECRMELHRVAYVWLIAIYENQTGCNSYARLISSAAPLLFIQIGIDILHKFDFFEMIPWYFMFKVYFWDCDFFCILQVWLLREKLVTYVNFNQDRFQSNACVTLHFYNRFVYERNE